MNKKILLLVKSSPTILYLAAFVYSLLHNSYYLTFVFSRKVTCRGVFFRKCRIVPSGKNCNVVIAPYSQIRDSLITLVGDNTKLFIDERTVIKNAGIHLLDNRSSINIGKGFTMEGGWIMSTEGNDITIGNDCMFSNDIEITNGDFHPIFIQNNDGLQIVNRGKCVRVSDHVWLGSHVRVLKGVSIGACNIVGNSSLVSCSLRESHSVYAGVPARLIKSNVDWKREHVQLLAK